MTCFSSRTTGVLLEEMDGPSVKHGKK